MADKPTKVVTGLVRLSYCHLDKPHSPDPTGKPKYSVTALLPKTDRVTKARLDAAIAAATQQGISSRWNGSKPPIVPNPIKDGDGVKASSGEEYPPECKGCWVFTATAQENQPKPRVVDLNRQDILDPAQIYSGMYGRISINVYPYNFNNKKGLAFGLEAVQKVSDGQPLSRTVDVDADFGEPIAVDNINPLTGQPY